MDDSSISPDWVPSEEHSRAQKFRETLGDRVQILADGLTPELVEIYMLERWSSMPTFWAAWVIKREVSEAGMKTICRKVSEWNVP